MSLVLSLLSVTVFLFNTRASSTRLSSYNGVPKAVIVILCNFRFSTSLRLSCVVALFSFASPLLYSSALSLTATPSFPLQYLDYVIHVAVCSNFSSLHSTELIPFFQPMDDETNFFERERARLAREITTVGIDENNR